MPWKAFLRIAYKEETLVCMLVHFRRAKSGACMQARLGVQAVHVGAPLRGAALEDAVHGQLQVGAQVAQPRAAARAIHPLEVHLLQWWACMRGDDEGWCRWPSNQPWMAA